MKNIPLAGAIFNISGGVCVIFFLDLLSPFLTVDPSSNMIFRLFVGGTAVLFGVGYINVYRDPEQHVSMLKYGAALKFWAFIISIFCYFQYGLSLLMLAGFGLGNLILGIMFVAYIRQNSMTYSNRLIH